MPIDIYDALQKIDEISLTPPSILVPIEESITKVAAEDLTATLPLPNFDNSAMDGYGIRGSSKSYKIRETILAGQEKDLVLSDGECVAIMTGARVPKSVERIIPKEMTSKKSDSISIDQLLPLGANIRKKGEDIDIGESIIKKGEIVNSSHIALLASQGITHIKVYATPRVAIFSSGDELKMHYEKLEGEADLYNSNTPYLVARANELGAQAFFLGRADDNLDSLKSKIKEALSYDLIITSGGVSVGEADFMKEAFKEMGLESFFDKVAIKPGKPTHFGRIGATLVLNLPGNPLASAMNFEIFGKFIINKLRGLSAPYHSYILTKSASNIISKKPVDSVIGGYFDGKSFMLPAKKVFPGSVNALNHCNCIIVIDKSTDEIDVGEELKILPIRWGFFSKHFVEFKS